MANETNIGCRENWENDLGQCTMPWHWDFIVLKSAPREAVAGSLVQEGKHQKPVVISAFLFLIQYTFKNAHYFECG